jgi:hypothetical protein
MDFVYIVATVLFFWLSWLFVRFCDSMDTNTGTARAESPREGAK